MDKLESVMSLNLYTISLTLFSRFSIKIKVKMLLKNTPVCIEKAISDFIFKTLFDF